VRIRTFAAVLILLGATAGAPSSAGDGIATDRLTRVVRLPPGVPIRVDATVAEVTITGSARADVAVDIVRRSPSDAGLAAYPARIDEGPDLLRISAVQPGEGRDPNLETRITLSVPALAIIQAVRVFEGRVMLANLRAACDVDIRRGTIDATGLAGRVRLEAGIGSIDLKEPELTAGGMMRLRVFNGPLRARFARIPANARILAVTLNGHISSDIPLTMKDKFGPRFGETTLGTGDPVMSADVVKGDIVIKVG